MMAVTKPIKCLVLLVNARTVGMSFTGGGGGRPDTSLVFYARGKDQGLSWLRCVFTIFVDRIFKNNTVCGGLKHWEHHYLRPRNILNLSICHISFFTLPDHFPPSPKVRKNFFPYLYFSLRAFLRQRMPSGENLPIVLLKGLPLRDKPWWLIWRLEFKI